MSEKVISTIHTINNTTSSMNWDNSKFNYDNMVRISVIGDGSCFFHALFKAFYVPYIKGYDGEEYLNRSKFVKDFRKYLSQALQDPNEDGIILYDLLSRGNLREFSDIVKDVSLDNMVKTLDSTEFAGHEHLELVSEILNKDIYILDLLNEDVYIVGNDDDLYYKDRNSIVLLYQPGHYELVGIDGNVMGKGLYTLFPFDSDFIKYIRNRMHIKRSSV